MQLFEEIGSGGFGRIYRAKWLTRDMIVAVKKLHLIHLNTDAEKNLLNELTFLHRIRHPNIISFYGACLDENDFYGLIMEYMSVGSLYQILHKQKLQLSWPHRLSIALQAAQGINYLHQYQPQILHCDIKSSNLLLENHHNKGYLIKVCDFGMAKTRDETTCQSETTCFTLSWTAPEVLRLTRHTDKSDIYSLSIVFWELSSYEIPYRGHQSDVIREFILAGNRLEIPDNTPLDFRSIIEKTWKQIPEDRPTSVHLLTMLNESIKRQGRSRISLSLHLLDDIFH